MVPSTRWHPNSITFSESGIQCNGRFLNFDGRYTGRYPGLGKGYRSFRPLLLTLSWKEMIFAFLVPNFMKSANCSNCCFSDICGHESATNRRTDIIADFLQVKGYLLVPKNTVNFSNSSSDNCLEEFVDGFFRFYIFFFSDILSF